MSDLTRTFEGLLDRIMRRAASVTPEPPKVTSEVVPEPAQSSGEGTIPLGGHQATSWEWYEDRIRLLESRLGMEREYNEMDAESSEVSAAFDIIADNATRGDQDAADGTPGASITLIAEDPRVLTVLVDVRRRLELDNMVWELARDLVKFGERIEEVVVDTKFDVTRLKPLPTMYVAPLLDPVSGLPVSPKQAWEQVNDEGKQVATFADWQIAHFANKKSRGDVFGTGWAFAARRPFKQLRLMEDALVIARLTRAHNRLAIFVDTGGLTPSEGQKHLDKVKGFFKKVRMMDPKTGNLRQGFNPLAIEEDLFIATHEKSKADVKVLQGDLTVGNIDDLSYFQQKVFTALKVPKSYLQYEKDARTKNVIGAQDIQFARSTRRLQSLIVLRLRQIFDFALRLKGIDPQRVSYTVALPSISISDDLREAQTEQLKQLNARMMKQTFWPSDEWLLTEYLGYATEDVTDILAGQVKPDKFNGMYQAPKVGAVANNTGSASESRAVTDMLEAMDDTELSILRAALARVRAVSPVEP